MSPGDRIMILTDMYCRVYDCYDTIPAGTVMQVKYVFSSKRYLIGTNIDGVYHNCHIDATDVIRI